MRNDAVNELKRMIEVALSQGSEKGTALREKGIDELIEEINIYYQELQFQNDELKRFDQDLEFARQKYEDLFMNAPVGYVTYDDEYHIQTVNSKMISLLGSVGSALEIGDLTNFIHPDSQDAFYLHVRSLIKQGNAQKCRLRLLGIEGIRTVIMESNLLHAADQSIIRSAVIDVSQEEALTRDLAATRTQLEEKNDQLQAYHDRLEATMLAGNIAWWQMDLTDGSVAFNEQKAIMLGYPMERFKKYTDFTALVHPEDYEPMMQAMRDYIEGRVDSYHCEYRIQAADGGYKWFRDTGSSFARDAAGQPTLVFGAAVDITELKAVQLEAERANHAKSEFLASMSHEIRTPLNAVIGYNQLMRQTKLDELQMEYAETSFEAAHNLLTILNDILDFSKIEAGQVELEEKEIDLREMLNQVRKMFLPQAVKRGLDLTLSLDDTLPVLITVDGLRLRQILINLVGNAVKFTEHGSVALSVNCRPDADDPGRGFLQFTVRDTGIGITEEQRERIFKAFSQGDVSITRRFGGTGLGLVISALLVRKMGGELEFTSQAGRGSEFHFSLHKACRSAVSAQAAEKEIRAPEIDVADERVSAAPCRVMIAEDVAVNLKLAWSLVKRILPNAELIPAVDGLEALSLFARDKPDLVLMDIQMPNMDGYTATREIRALEAGVARRTPILGLSAGAFKADFDQALLAGMDDYITKPIDYGALRDKVLGLLRAAGTSPSAAESQPKRDQASASTIHFDLAALTEQVAGDTALIAEMLALSREQFPLYSRELTKAIQENNRDQIHRIAHKFRGSALTLVCNPLGALLTRVEAGYQEDLEQLKSIKAEIDRELDAVMAEMNAAGAAGA